MILRTKRCILLSAVLIFVLFSITDCKRGGGRRGGTYRGSSNVWGRAKQSQGTQANYDLYANGQRRSKSQGEPSPDAIKKADAAGAQKASAPPSPTNRDVKKPAVGASSADFIQQEKKQQLAPLNTANTQQRPAGWDVGQGTKTDGNINKNVANSNTNTQQRPTGWDAGQGTKTDVANSNTQQRPIGWNVGQGAKTDGNINKQVGWNVGNANPAQGSGSHGYASSANLGNQPVYPSHVGAYPNTGANNYYGTGSNYNYGNGYQQSYNPNQHPGQYPNSNMGGMQHQGYNGGAMPGNNYYGGGAMPGNNYGGGGMFGGNKYGNQGYGGYGGYGSGYGSPGGFGGFGGYGGNGIGGYGKKYGGGFGSGFGKHAFRNVMVGLLVWNLVSGFTRRPYNVYNYYNNPEQIPTEIPLPANAIVLCPENVTSLCAPNTAPLCTSTGTIMCVVLAQQTVPCDNNSTLKCVNSTVTCTDEEPCDDKGNKNATTSVNIPCVTNATITGKLMDNTTLPFSGTGVGDTTALCVTTFATPQPEEEANKAVEPLCGQNGQTENANGTIPCTGNSTDLSQASTPTLNTNITVPNLQNVTYPLAM